MASLHSLKLGFELGNVFEFFVLNPQKSLGPKSFYMKVFNASKEASMNLFWHDKVV